MALGTARPLRGQPSRTPLQRTLWASGWMYGSRALVFGWALLFTYEFGIWMYGIYALAFAAGSVLAVPLDSYFNTRSPRVATEVFVRERTTRMLVGLGLVLVGLVLWPLTFALGFASVKAGSDVAFQASRSQLVRMGHPDRAQQADAFRQIVGVVVASAYVVLAPSPVPAIAAALYLAGSALPIILGLQALTHARPSLPEVNSRSAVIVAESVGGVLYVQIDVILLGLLVSPQAAGYYSFGATVVWSLAALGQSFGTTYHERLRLARGDAAAGPPLGTAVLLSAGTALLVGLIAVGLWLAGFPDPLWITFALLAVVSFLRTLSSVATVVLVLQHRDRFRLVVTVVAVVVKVALILLLQQYGGPGAALAFIVADVVMSGAYALAVYGRRSRREPTGG